MSITEDNKRQLNSFKNNASKAKMIYGVGNASQLIIKKLKILSIKNKLK